MSPAGNLPRQLTTFVGRRGMIVVAGRRLAEDRLVSLVGPGGCGKTRLAVEVGRQLESSRSDGVFFVDLSGLSDPSLVPGLVADTLGLHNAGGANPDQALVAYLGQRQVLLLLDNCEHVLDAAAALAVRLVRGCPKLWLLATSRHVLGLAGEVVMSVDGLALPDRAAGLAGLAASEAGSLFIHRAQRAWPEFRLDDDSASAVAEICERLDGIPFALELAAARTQLMSVREIAQELSVRSWLRAASSRSAPERHRSLVSSIEWSCRLLSDKERAVLYRMSVFAAGFTIASAEVVCAGGDVPPDEMLT